MNQGIGWSSYITKQDLKIFPYILARIGGLAFDQLENISWSEKEQLAEYFKAAEELENQRIQILSSLLEIINSIENYPAKFYLKIFRRDIYNYRNLKIKPFQYDGAFEKEFYEVVEKVKLYKNKRLNVAKLVTDFEILYQKEVVRVRHLFQDKKFPDPLTKGLQLASHSLLDRLKAYQQKGGQGLNKKLLQTERKLLQYLSRIAAKTSPFSSFTQLAIIDLKNNLDYVSQRKVRLNNSIFRFFRDVLIHYPAFYKPLKIRLNPAIWLSGKEELKFLLNTRNIESVQSIEKSELIDFFIEALSEAEKEYTFSEFIEMLAEHIEAKRDDLEKYLLELIDYGLIEWNWPFSGLNPQWHIALRELLTQYKAGALLTELGEALTTIERWMQDFENGNLEERAGVQQKAFDQLNNIAEKFLEATKLKGVEQIVTSKHLKNIISATFTLKKEEVFYEDVSQTMNSDYSKNDFELVAQELNQLTNILSPFYYNASKEKYLSFFKSNYSTKKVSLLNFYEDYFKKPLNEAPAIDDSEITKRKNYLKQLINKGDWLNLDHFHLDFSAFPVIGQTFKDQHLSKATFLQLYKKDGVTQAFTDSTFMGYGKMFGRFLHLFPRKITQAISETNAALNDGFLWVENVDASIYNPNVHPALIAHEIQMPGSQNNLPANHQVPIRDLEVHLDSDSDSDVLFLFDKKRNKRVIIFDYGFEALDNRSAMYQLLATFNYQLTGPEILTDLLDNQLLQKDEKGIIHRPRISVGKHLVIRRRGWGIPKTLLPEKANAESSANYFLRLNQWRQNLSLPEKVFITIDSPDFKTDKNIRSSSDDYKPQYIDFTSPLFVQLFSKLISKTPAYLKIEEMLPVPVKNSNNQGQFFVAEYLMEWSDD